MQHSNGWQRLIKQLTVTRWIYSVSQCVKAARGHPVSCKLFTHFWYSDSFLSFLSLFRGQRRALDLGSELRLNVFSLILSFIVHSLLILVTSHSRAVIYYLAEKYTVSKLYPENKLHNPAQIRSSVTWYNKEIKRVLFAIWVLSTYLFYAIHMNFMIMYNLRILTHTG